MNNIIKQYIRILFVIIIFSASQSLAIDVMKLPPLDNFIVDYTNTLTSSQIESFVSGTYQIQQQTSAQIAALIIPDRGGYELYDIALKVFRDSKLWTKDLNNGLLLIISKDEKKLRLTVWYGLEWTIPDVLAREMIDQIRTYVNSGDIYGAIQTYYDLITPYVQWTGKARSEETIGYQITIWDQIRGIILFLAMSSALWSKHLKNISLSKNKQKSLSSNIISIGTIWLIIIAIISFSLISFGFFGWLLWYIFWLITGNGQWFTLNWWRGRGYYGWGGFTGGWWWWSSRWWGGGWFSGWFGGSSWWGGAGD